MPRRKREHKWLKRILFLVLVVGAVVVCYFVWDGYFRDKGENPGEETGSAEFIERQGAGKPEGTLEKPVEKPDEEVAEEKKVSQYEGEDPNTAESLTGAVTYAGVNGEELLIRVNIDQYLGAGSCELSLVREGTAIYSETVLTDSSAATATCQGFNVPVAEIGGVGAGKIQIIIYVGADGKTGEIRGEVTL